MKPLIRSDAMRWLLWKDYRHNRLILGTALFLLVVPYGLAVARAIVWILVNGTPSIVVGVVAWTLIVAKQKHFSGFAGSVALAILMIPTVLWSVVLLALAILVSVMQAFVFSLLTVIADDPRGFGRIVRNCGSISCRPIRPALIRLSASGGTFGAT